MDKLRAIEAALAIADHGSLTEAGKRLGRSLPAMVRSLAALEETLGVRLFHRTTRHVEPTAEGRAYLSQCRRLTADLAQIEAELAGGTAAAAGLVTVTAPLSFGERHVAPALARIGKAHSGLQLGLTLNDRILDLIERQIDIAVRIGHLPDSGLRARKVGEVAQVLAAAPDLVAETGVPETPEDLRALPCLVNAGNDAGTRWRFRHAAGGLRHVQVAGGFTADTVGPLAAACRAGLGFGLFLGYQVADDLAAGRLLRLLPAREPPPLPVHLVHAATRFVPARMQVVLDGLAEALEAATRQAAARAAQALPAPGPGPISTIC